MLAVNRILQEKSGSFNRVKLMCNELAAYLSDQYSREIKGTYECDGAEAYYEGCSPEEQQVVFKNLLNYYSLILDAVSKEVDLNNSRDALKHSLAWNNLATYDAIFTEITNDSVIEMFDLELCQIWRSNNFFKYSSHSLAALFCKPFQLNFKKEPAEVEGQIVEAVTKVLTQAEDWVCNVTKDHNIVEIGSAKKIENKGSLKYVSALLKDKEPSGVISVIQVDSTTISGLESV